MLPLIEATMDLNADCAEFCPVPGCQRQLAVGTYQLQEDVQERTGRYWKNLLSSHLAFKSISAILLIRCKEIIRNLLLIEEKENSGTHSPQ